MNFSLVPAVRARPTLACILLGLVCGPAAAADHPVAAAWNWRLAGVIVGPGVGRAVFARDGETQGVAQGRQIDGWTLAAIRPDGVTLEGPAGEKVLGLEAPPSSGVSVAARQATPAALTVAQAAREQRQEQVAAEAALAAATKQMERAGGGRSR